MSVFLFIELQAYGFGAIRTIRLYKKLPPRFKKVKTRYTTKLE
jgi:hypothetical protein